MTDLAPMREVSDLLVESGGEDLLSCFQCGTCTGVCPVGITSVMRVREIIHMMQLGLEGFESEDLWKCLTCHTCVERCPRGVGIAEVISIARSIMVETGTYPKSLQTAVGSLSAAGNPWQGEPDQRRDWAKDLKIEQFDPEKHEYVLFVCCTQAFDPRTKATARAAVKVLSAAGAGFGLLPMEKEICCGDLALRVGANDQFESLKNRLGPTLEECGTKVVVLSPHCRETFNNSYENGFESVHIVELLAGLLEEGRLEIKKPFEKKVTYHDPCYLGRRGGVYEAPRKLLRAVPGLEFVEMDRNRARSICCGGGGGGAFSETEKDERLAPLRINQASETDASVIATACPYCILMLEDAVTTQNMEDDLRVMDVIEILAECLENE